MNLIYKKVLKIFILSLIFYSLLVINSSNAKGMNNILSEPWPCSESYDIGKNLPQTCEPSGLTWNPLLNSLFLVSDDGTLYQMDTEGNIVHNWSPGGDLEGVAVVEKRNSYVYLGIEHPDSIKEFDLSTGTLTSRSWDLTSWMIGPDNQGLEALTFVPDGYHPYNCSSSGGLFYAGLQADGKIYVFDVNLSTSGNVSYITTLSPKSNLNDISGLYFCRETNILYAIYDEANILVEMKTDGTVLKEYNLPNKDQEAFTIIPSIKGNGEVFIGEDAGTLWRWKPYPTIFNRIHPQGTLIQVKSPYSPADPAVYIIEKINCRNRKRHIPDPNVYLSQYQTWNKIVAVSTNERDSYPSGTIWSYRDGELVKEQNNHTVYLFEEGKKRKITSASVFNAYKFSWNNILVVPDGSLSKFDSASDLSSYSANSYPSGSLLKEANNPCVYRLEKIAGIKYKRPFHSASSYLSQYYSWNKIITVSSSVLNSYPTYNQPVPYRDGELVKEKSKPEVYVFENGKKRWITNPQTFNTYGYSWSNVIIVPDKDLNPFSSGDPLSI